MDWKLLWIFGCTVLFSVYGIEEPRASSYVYRSFDSVPSHVVYLRPARARLSFPSSDKHAAIEIKANLRHAGDSSEESGTTDDSAEAESKVLSLKGSREFVESEEAFDEHHNSKDGTKNRHGFNKQHNLKKESKGSHGKENHSHSYAKEGEKDKSHHDEDSYQQNHHDKEHHTRGGKHSEKKHHKKGSKTTGYHNVYHKDEFKKEHIFYDTADHSGSFRKYGSSHKEQSDDNGEYANGGHKEESRTKKKHSQKGYSTDGKYDSNHNEFKKDRKDTNDYRHRSEFKNENRQFGSNEHGYKIYHQ
ncbi:dentin sialophosphoprotein-like [Wyeomyia smithii]|uniref:dentin sialophosphoprotein-like n=1 Tax=Wyeomyia smithii TaxID=174621 RepID=UPI002467C9DC|nr:dentin sialophosphoprotein-like [Wyeomyia smithii]